MITSQLRLIASVQGATTVVDQQFSVWATFEVARAPIHGLRVTVREAEEWIGEARVVARVGEVEWQTSFRREGSELEAMLTELKIEKARFWRRLPALVLEIVGVGGRLGLHTIEVGLGSLDDRTNGVPICFDVEVLPDELPVRDPALDSGNAPAYEIAFAGHEVLLSARRFDLDAVNRPLRAHVGRLQKNEQERPAVFHLNLDEHTPYGDVWRAGSDIKLGARNGALFTLTLLEQRLERRAVEFLIEEPPHTGLAALIPFVRVTSSSIEVTTPSAREWSACSEDELSAGAALHERMPAIAVLASADVPVGRVMYVIRLARHCAYRRLGYDGLGVQLGLDG